MVGGRSVYAPVEIFQSFARLDAQPQLSLRCFHFSEAGGGLTIDAKAALRWLMNRQPALWRDRQEANVTGTVAHRISQMSADQRAAHALELAERVRRRVEEYRATIEHEPIAEPAPEPAPEPESEE